MNSISSSRPSSLSAKPARRIAAWGLLMLCLLSGTTLLLFTQNDSAAGNRPVPPSHAPEGLPKSAPELTFKPDPVQVVPPAIPDAALPGRVEGWKTGTVDMARIFREYHKTLEAERSLNEDKSKAKTELDARSGRQRELGLRLKEVEKILADRLVNEELKQQKRLEAEPLLQEYRRLTTELQEFAGRRERQLHEHSGRLRKALQNEILGYVQDKAKRDRYDFVFDKSGQGISGSPLLLATRDAVDFTSEVILELNRQSPVARAGTTGH